MSMNRSDFSFQDAVDFLYQFINYERVSNVKYNVQNYDLNSFEQFLKTIGQPQANLKAIHIGGTKGKGSTAAMITSILDANDYSCGLYTSPHLVDIRERIRIDGKAISKSDFTYLAAQISEAIESSRTVLPPGYRTTFECLTAMAFLCFQSFGVDWSVLEVGMGGRLDCTNVVEPQICVITPIDLDHTDSLGHSLTGITKEKAGIFKVNVPVVVAPQHETVMDQLRICAEDTASELIEINPAEKIEIQSMNMEGSVFSTCFEDYQLNDLFIPLIGRFQIENAVTALRVIIELLRRGKIEVSTDRIRHGLSRLKWPGRLSRIIANRSVLPVKPEYMFADGAHNPSAAIRLVESISSILPETKIDLIIGMPANKDADGVLSALAPIARRIVVTRYNNPRALKISQIREKACRYHSDVIEAEDLMQALSVCAGVADPSRAVLVTGSLYLVGELYEISGNNVQSLNIW